MALSTLQTSFLGGELSPSMYSRVDDAFYKIGAARVSNFLIKPTGVLQKRAGFRFVKEFDASKKIRLIPFRFSSTQTLVLIFTDKLMYISTEGQMLLNSNGQPYTVTSPFDDDDLASLSYSQNADIVTLTSLNYPPYELRRYGATDWRFQTIKTIPDIQPPSNINADATYPEDVLNGSTDINDDNYNANTATMDVIEARYVVTAINEDGIESEASEPCIINCNYYIEGATVVVEWGEVEGASSYRVYRYVSGIYGFLAETAELTITDDGTIPDTAQTPPRYKDPFLGTTEAGRIISIKVVDGGEDYWVGNDGSSGVKDGEIILKTLPFVTFITNSSSSMPQVPNVEFTVKVTGTSDGSTPTGTITYEQAYYKEEHDHVYDGNASTSDDTYYVTATLAPPLSIFDAQKGFRVQLDREVLIGNNTKIVITSNRPSPKWRGYTETEPAGVKHLDPAYTGMLSFAVNNWSKIAYTTSHSSSIIGRAYWLEINTSYTSIVFGSSDAESSSYTLDMKITDSTGTGAKAQAVAKNGVIQSVRVIASGKNYTNPTVSVVGSEGTGARFQANVSGPGEAEYPRCSCQFDQRRIFAGSTKAPLKVWMTQAGSQDLMSYHVPILDTDRIEIVAVTNDADMIKHAIGLESLILFTGSSELRVYTQNSQALSPSSVAVRAQSYVGANDVQPIVANNSIVYIASRGGHPRQISYSYNSAAYTSDDLGVRCPHLFDGKDIVSLSLSKAPVPLIYAVSTDGTLKVCIYIPEQQIVGWFTYETKGQIESACAVAEGLEDRLYIIVRRTINGEERLYLEHMSLTDPEPEFFRCMDSYLDADFTQAESSVSGLDHLEGEEVCVFVDGKQQANQIVKDGSIELEEAGKSISVGLPVTAQLITMPVEYASASVITHQRAISKVKLRCAGDGDIWTGVFPQTEYDHLYPCDKSEAFYKVQNQDSYVVDATITGTWDPQTQLIIESRDCYPMQLMAILCDTEYTQAVKTKTRS